MAVTAVSSAALPASTPQPTTAAGLAAAELKQKNDSRQSLLNEISAKWNEFTSPELSAIKTADELVKQVVIKTGVDKAVAKSQVEAILKGRPLLPKA